MQCLRVRAQCNPIMQFRAKELRRIDRCARLNMATACSGVPMHAAVQSSLAIRRLAQIRFDLFH